MPEQELTLGDILGLLLKRWGVLATSFVLVFIVVFALTRLLPDMYRAEATLLVMNSKLRNKQMGHDYLGITVESFLSLVSNKQALSSLLDELAAYQKAHPDSPLPERMSLMDLSRRVRVSEVRNSQCLSIRVDLEVPELASDLANQLADRAVAANAELLGMDSSDSMHDIQRRVLSSSDELQLAMKSLLDFQREARLEELELGIKIAYGQVESWEVQKQNLEIQIREGRQKVTALSAEIASSSPRITLKKLVTEQPELVEILREKSRSTSQSVDILGLSLNEEVLNPVYSTLTAELSSASVELSANLAKHVELEARLRGLRADLELLMEEKYQKDMLLQKHQLRFELARKQFERYETLQSEVDAVVSTERQDLRVIDRAVTPERPIGPNRLLLAVTAAALASILAFFGFLAKDIYHMV